MSVAQVDSAGLGVLRHVFNEFGYMGYTTWEVADGGLFAAKPNPEAPECGVVTAEAAAIIAKRLSSGVTADET